MITLLAATSASPSLGDMAAVAAACLVAGAVNALAGGGSLLSYPTMVAVGLGPVAANVSNTLALWPGYASGAVTLRKRVSEADARLPAFVIAAVIGSALGTVLLLAGDPDTFEAVVPFLVILAALLLAVPEHWLERLRSHPRAGGVSAAVVGAGIAAIYGSYFGGGLGVIMLAVLNAFVGSNLRGLNAVKAVLSLVINTVALVAFVGFGPVTWWAVAVGGPAALVGGIGGARLADRVDIGALRRIVVVLGIAAGIALLVT